MLSPPEDLPAAALGEAMAYIELHQLELLVAEALEAAVVSRSPDPVAFLVLWLRRKHRASVAARAAADEASRRGDYTTLEELHAAHAARAALKAHDEKHDVLRTTLLPEPVLRSIYAVASESSLTAALARAPPSLRDAVACREGLWGGLVHMMLCSFSDHGGVDVHAATEALVASGVREMAAARSLSIPAECWSWGRPQRASVSMYAGRHILVCNLTGGSDCMSAVVEECDQRGLKNPRGMEDLHVILPLAGTDMPASDADIRAFLARLEWELAVVRLEGPKTATTPLRVEYRRALALSPDVIRQFLLNR